MKETFNVEGMMCSHCEKRVKDAISKLDGIVDLDVSAEKGTVSVEFASPTDRETIIAAIEDTGYDVI